jgi:hypothetical protein
MQKHKGLMVLGALLGVTAILFALLVHRWGPHYQGHSLNYWLARYGKCLQDSMNVDPEALGVISRLDTNALPFLLSRIHHDPSRLYRSARRLQRYMPGPLNSDSLLDLMYSDRAARDADTAASALIAIGAGARPAMPDLCRIARDPSTPETAARAQSVLASFGQSALPFLLTVIQDTNAPNRYKSVSCLVNPDLRTNDATVIPALIACLKDKDIRVCRSAAQSLAAFHLQPELIVPALINAAKTIPDRGTRFDTVVTLAQFAPHSRPAMAYLEGALSDPDPSVRFAATHYLDDVAPELLTNDLPH